MGKHCIFMVVNDAFAVGAIITLYSFLKNNPWYDEDIIIGCGADEGWGLSDENKEMLQNLYHKIRIVDLKFNEFYDIYDSLIPIAQSGVGFEMTVYKFHAFRLTDYQRVIVFDADMLVLGNIKELFEMDIEFGGLYEVKYEDFSNDIFKKRTNEYFNAGIMVIGKKYLNEETIIKCDNLLKSPEIFEKSKIPHYGGLYPEQDILNVLTENENVILIPRTYSADRFFCDENNTKDVKVVHYLKYLKPWRVFNGEYEYQGWTQDEWEEYYNSYNEWVDRYTLTIGDFVRKFNKAYDDKDKYLVATCAKNENAYIREWIQHYLDLNFDKIIICDNNDDDSLLNVISDYIEQGAVEVFDCRGLSLPDFQSEIMGMICSEGNYKWCAYFDCDEFLELNSYNDIKQYLYDKDGDSLAFNWMMFDSNRVIKYEPQNVQERFPMPYFPLMNIENTFVKSIVRGGHFRYSKMFTNGVHMFRRADGCNMLYNFGGCFLTTQVDKNLQSSAVINYKEGYIKHYYTKSFNEWLCKSKRGWGDVKKELTASRFFRLYNENKYDVEKYKNSLFLDDELLDTLNDDGPDDVNFYIYQNLSRCSYPYFVRIMRSMTKKKDKVFILYDENISNEMCMLLLECAFVTNNKIAFAKEELEIENIFKKYCSDSVINYWKKII